MLHDIDERYYNQLMALRERFEHKEISADQLNRQAGLVAIETIYATRKAVGRKICQRIYGVMVDEQEVVSSLQGHRIINTKPSAGEGFWGISQDLDEDKLQIKPFTDDTGYSEAE